MPDPLTITAAGAWAWDKYGKSLTDKAASAFKDGWTKSRWKKASDDYRKKINSLYGAMQIMGMAEPVPLDDIFTEAYLLDKPTAFSRFNIERLKQASVDPDAPPPNAKRVGGLALVKRNKNLFILGKPGAGKTTFLKYIAVQAAAPEKPVIDRVPVFISLKRWADSEMELLPFIVKQFDNCDFPEARPFVEELLKSGGAIVLFDGLDEVNQEGGQRDKQTRAMNDFIEKYDRTQCLITCRLAASDYSFKPFTYVEIADFTEKQIETFVANWFRTQEGEKDEETSKRFLAEFKKDDNKGLRDLARTPLLLTLLSLSFNETLTFPQRRVEIYKEALDALLKKWDSSRRIKRDEVYRKLSLGHKENMLARIAAETFEKNQYFISQEELERLIADFVKNIPPHDTNEMTDGETILKAIEAQHGIFVERAHKVYSFSHLTFQEYFTAKYVVDNAAKGTLSELVKAHCADARWREVFLLTTSLLPDASQFIKTFRRVVDEILAGDEKLFILLTRASEKAARSQGEAWKVRPTYILAEIYHRDISTELDRAFTKSLIYALNTDQLLEFDFSITVAIKNVFEPRFINTFSPYLDGSRASKLGFNDLAKELSALSIPTDDTPATERRKIADVWRALLRKYRNTGYDWNLTEEQEVRLRDHINSTNLLLDCLGLAFMPPEEKTVMLNSLYLPPGTAGVVEDD